VPHRGFQVIDITSAPALAALNQPRRLGRGKLARVLVVAAVGDISQRRDARSGRGTLEGDGQGTGKIDCGHPLARLQAINHRRGLIARHPQGDPPARPAPV